MLPNKDQSTGVVGAELKNPSESVRFNVAKAVNRLLAGEPPQYVFGLTFGWPLVSLTEKDLRGPYVIDAGGYKKAVRAIVLTSAAGDAVRILSNLPTESIANVPFFNNLADPVDSKLINSSFTPLWQEVFGETHRSLAQIGINNSMLTRVTNACDTLLLDIRNRVQEIAVGQLTVNSKTLDARFIPYLNLLAEVFETKNSRQPSVGELCDLAISSYAVFGRPASADMGYLSTYNLATQSSARQTYDPEKFELRETSGGESAVVVKRDVRADIDAKYEQSKGEFIDVITGCPANVAASDPYYKGELPNMSLIEAMIYRFVNKVKSNVNKQ